MKRLPILLSCVLLLAGAWNQAQAQGATPRSYSVLSELARELQIITFQESIGSNLDQNIKQRMPIPGGAIDRAALALAKAEVLATEPGVRVTTFAPLDSDVFDARQSFREGSDVGLPPDLKDALKEQGSSHLLLLTRHLADTSIQTRFGKVGGGRMEGLGFFIDNQTLLDRNIDAPSSRGFLAPFVYIRATLIDARSGRVVRSRVHTHSEAIAGSRGTESAHPWDALNAQEKVRIITEMLDQGLKKLVPATLGRR